MATRWCTSWRQVRRASGWKRWREGLRGHRARGAEGRGGGSAFGSTGRVQREDGGAGRNPPVSGGVRASGIVMAVGLASGRDDEELPVRGEPSVGGARGPPA